MWTFLIGEHGKPESGRCREMEFKYSMSHVVLGLVGLRDFDL